MIAALCSRAAEKAIRRMSMRRAFPVVALCVFSAGQLATGAGWGTARAGEAPVTLEVLSALRAERDFRKESLRVDGDPFAGTAALVPVGGIAIADAIGLLRRGYEIPLCTEWDLDAHDAPPPIQFSIHEGERLVDALDSLEEASGGTARWRLLEGRIVITVRAAHEVEVPGMLDQIVEVAIEETSLRDALLELEASFNEQHRYGLPFLLGLGCDIADAQARVPYRLSGRMTLREAILGLLSQMDDPWATYSLTQYGGRAAQNRVLIRTRPCAEVRDALIRIEASGERRNQYQQAIDEARAAAEREQQNLEN